MAELQAAEKSDYANYSAIWLRFSMSAKAEITGQ
jgi:hypothetical protein